MAVVIGHGLMSTKWNGCRGIYVFLGKTFYLEGKCTLIILKTYKRENPFINLQFIVYISTILYSGIGLVYQGHFNLCGVLWGVCLVCLGMRSNLIRVLYGRRKSINMVHIVIKIQINSINRIQFIGDRCGIDVHREVTLAWQATDIRLTSTSGVGCRSFDEWFSIYCFYSDWYKWVIGSADFWALAIEYAWPSYRKS